MKITELNATAINIPRQNRLTTSYGSIDFAPTLLIEIKSDEGVTGYGQVSIDAPFYGETGEGMLVNIRKHLAPALIGHDSRNRETALLALDARVEGAPAAKAALDIKGTM